VDVTQKDISFARLMGVSISSKMLIDIAVQIFNPFLPIIATGLNTDVITMGRLLSLRSLMGLTSPVFGVVADRRGFRLIIRLGLLLTAIAMFIMGASTGVWTAATAMVIMGIGVAAFVPTLQAYVSARLPYGQRARGLGIVEYSWALTGIFGLSLAGLIIAWTSWRVPMFLLGAGMLVMWAVFARMPSAREAAASQTVREVGRRRFSAAAARSYFAIGANARSTYFTILTGALTYFAGMQIMIIYGVWLKDDFGLGAGQLGLVALIFGFFDLAASVSVSLFTDRIGKRRSVIIGGVTALVWYLLIPWSGSTLALAVLALAMARMGFEFSIVSYFPLLSEQTPEQRGKVMTLGSATSLLFATAAGFTSPWLYTQYGIRGPASLAALSAVAAILVALTLVRERYG
jgi:MFS family permease